MQLIKEFLLELVMAAAVFTAEVATHITTLADRCSDWAYSTTHNLRNK